MKTSLIAFVTLAIAGGCIADRIAFLKARERESYFLMFASLLEQARAEGRHSVSTIEDLTYGTQTENELMENMYVGEQESPLFTFSSDGEGGFLLSEREEHYVRIFRADKLRIGNDGVVRWLKSNVVVDTKH